MNEICTDTVDLIFFIISDYLQAKLRVGRAKFVFSVAGHEIICMPITHSHLLSVARPALSEGRTVCARHYSACVNESCCFLLLLYITTKETFNPITLKHCLVMHCSI